VGSVRGEEEAMTFISDMNILRTWDPDRGYELLPTTGGSDGRRGHRITAPGGECHFDVYSRVRDANPAERARRPEIEKTVVYEVSNVGPVLPGLSRKETYEVIREALLAERLSPRHDEVNWAVIVPAA
jgi:hypothetical protein